MIVDGLERVCEDSLLRFDASVGVNAVQQPISHGNGRQSLLALNAPSFMCVNATGLERPFEDSLLRFDSSVGVNSVQQPVIHG